METKKVYLPNNFQNPLFEVVYESFAEGKEVTISFGGNSMLPLLHNQGDSITLRPLKEDEKVKVGEIYLFRHCGHHIVHRLIAIEGDEYIFRGDNCVKTEQVKRHDIAALLVKVIRQKSGKMISTQSLEWRIPSFLVWKSRKSKIFLLQRLNSEGRKVLFPWYLVFLILLMWLPLNGLNLPLNNFILGLRVDHLLHALAFLPLGWMINDFHSLPRWSTLPIAFLIACTTELVQYLLPYRSFDINDLLANLLSVAVSWILARIWIRRKMKRKGF